jgi:hypothetical protein
MTATIIDGRAIAKTVRMACKARADALSAVDNTIQAAERQSPGFTRRKFATA